MVDDVAGSSSGAASAQQAQFVGSTACTTCHAQQGELWRGSHHDLAMQEANRGTVLGDFDGGTFEHRGRTTRFSRRGDGFWVQTEGPGGEQQDFQIAYTFGVAPLQQYLVAFPDGRYQALDIA